MELCHERLSHQQVSNALQALTIEFPSNSDSDYSDRAPVLSPAIGADSNSGDNSSDSFPPVLSPFNLYIQEAAEAEALKYKREKEGSSSSVRRKSGIVLKLKRGSRSLQEMQSQKPPMMKYEIFESKSDRKRKALQSSYEELTKNLKILEGELSSFVSQEKMKLEQRVKLPVEPAEEITESEEGRKKRRMLSPETLISPMPSQEPLQKPTDNDVTQHRKTETVPMQSIVQPNELENSASQSDDGLILESESSANRSTTEMNDAVVITSELVKPKKSQNLDAIYQDDVLLLYDDDPVDFLDL